jgi:hypothetical protein
MAGVWLTRDRPPNPKHSLNRSLGGGVARGAGSRQIKHLAVHQFESDIGRVRAGCPWAGPEGALTVCVACQ